MYSDKSSFCALLGDVVQCLLKMEISPSDEAICILLCSSSPANPLSPAIEEPPADPHTHTTAAAEAALNSSNLFPPPTGGAVDPLPAAACGDRALSRRSSTTSSPRGLLSKSPARPSSKATDAPGPAPKLSPAGIHTPPSSSGSLPVDSPSAAAAAAPAQGARRFHANFPSFSALPRFFSVFGNDDEPFNIVRCRWQFVLIQKLCIGSLP